MPEEQGVLDEHKSVTSQDETTVVTRLHGTRGQKPTKQKSGVKNGLPSKAKLRFLGVAMMIIVSLSAGFLGGWFGSTHLDNASPSVEKQQVILQTQSQLISSIAKTVGASVVSVQVQGTTTDSSSSLFGLPQSTTQESAGTGIILTKDGLIITNRHVVPDGTTSVSVTLADGTTFNNVQVVGRTAPTDSLDIAFLKISNTQGKQLTPATLGDSSSVSVGDSVVAIGNALGQFQNTVTSGIISGFGRSVQASDSDGSSSENLENLFQTDAAINEGNSGGPLVNINGQVIGINTAIAGNAQNIGFAIPINDVKGTINSVEITGKLNRPYLGVVFVPITPDVASQYNLKVSQGAYIPPSSLLGTASVISGGPADQAGIKEGDIITKVNSETINADNSLTSLLDQYQPGNKIQLTVNRNGKQLTLTVTVGTAPAG